jgi:hypothetical protein
MPALLVPTMLMPTMLMPTMPRLLVSAMSMLLPMLTVPVTAPRPRLDAALS